MPPLIEFRMFVFDLGVFIFTDSGLLFMSGSRIALVGPEISWNYLPQPVKPRVLNK
jgi:hypothetical protein